MFQWIQQVDLKVFMLTIAFSGCGGSPSVEVPVNQNPQSESPIQLEKKLDFSDDPISDPARSLGLRVVSEDLRGNRPSVPDATRSLDEKTALDDSTIEKNEILLHSKLFLADPLSPNPHKKMEHFFVWPEKSLGSQIVSATYSHRIQTLKGEWIGNFESKLVWHEPQNHRWYIPLAEIFKGRSQYSPMDVNLEDTQVMSVELHLESGQQVIIQIKFQVSGPLPVTHVSALMHWVPSKVSELVLDPEKKGWVIHSEEFVNPTSRLFHLWIRYQDFGRKLTLKSHLQQTFWTARPTEAPLGPFPSYYLALGHLERILLELRYANRSPLVRKMIAQEWERFDLEPFEKVRLVWLATPSESAAECVLPLAQNTTYSWVTTSEATSFTRLKPVTLAELARGKDPLVRVTIPGTPTYHHITKSHDWSFVGAKLEGQWSREIRLVHPFMSKNEATQENVNDGSSNEHLLMIQGPVNTKISVGNIEGSRTSYSCQGVFR